MGTGDFTVGGNPGMDKHTIQGGRVFIRHQRSENSPSTT